MANRNLIVLDGWSNPDSERRYRERWPGEPEVRARADDGAQCGGCSFFAPLDGDWGLCLNPVARHHAETVFEHFSCPAFVGEGWGPHSFTERADGHCHCGGGPPPEGLLASESRTEGDPDPR